MKSSLDKVVVDARQLASRMRARDEAAEGLLGQASWVQSRLDAMRQYQEEVLSMSEQSNHNQQQKCQADGSSSTSSTPAGPQPLGSFLLGFTAENRELDELRGDNEELRAALDEHQAALELIMTKYRGQISSMMRHEANQQGGSGGSQGGQESSSSGGDDPLAVSRMMDRLQQLSHMIRQTNAEGEVHSSEMEAVVQQLLTENQGLRQLVNISRQHRVLPPAAIIPSPSPPPASNTTSEELIVVPPPGDNPEEAAGAAAALAALDSLVNNLSDDEGEEDGESSSSASSTINLSASQSSVSSVNSVATVAASPVNSEDEEEEGVASGVDEGDH